MNLLAQSCALLKASVLCRVWIHRACLVHLQVIAELDEKKREALEKTWVRVNQDFGSIFSTLLPGTSAKLEPQEGQSFLNGETLNPPCYAPDTALFCLEHSLAECIHGARPRIIELLSLRHLRA